MSYAYQWQQCNASGEACVSIGGASAPEYAVGESDSGHTLRVVVTASNGAGSASQASVVTSVVQGKSTICTTTVSSSTSASAIAGAIVSAHDGDTVCLGGGTYPSIHINGATHGSYVTVRPTPGATATVAGFEVANSSFLRFQGFHMTAGFNMRDGSTYSGSHDYQFLENTFENDVYGIVLYGGAGPIKKVLIERNYMRKIDFPGEACNPGYAGGQGVSIWFADGITIAHNTFKEISWHYIQGGASGTAGVTVEHNLFEGPIPADRLSCTHLNVWQIWDGGSNDTFSNNIVRGKPGSPAAVTPILFETGAGGGTCSASLSNSVITNNLFVYSSTAYAVQVLTTTNLTFTNNTSVGSEYGIWLDRSDTCGPGTNYDIERNISVENIGHSPDFALGECTGTCIYDYNVSQDGSASGSGSQHNLINWKPSFIDTSSYEANGLPFFAGYQGGGGP
jgi:Right handed beta helix region